MIAYLTGLVLFFAVTRFCDFLPPEYPRFREPEHKTLQERK